VTRLDSVIRRLMAQRACIDAAVAMIENVAGAVLEIGLGNGRTYDHMRDRLPGREIYAFDRAVAAHPDCIPDADHLFLGDVRETLRIAGKRIGGPAALVHADVGSGDPAANARLAQELMPLIAALVAAGGVILSDQTMDQPGWTPLPLPDGVAAGRYHLYRA
jgi:hypothetical protein